LGRSLTLVNNDAATESAALILVFRVVRCPRRTQIIRTSSAVSEVRQYTNRFQTGLRSAVLETWDRRLEMAKHKDFMCTPPTLVRMPLSACWPFLKRCKDKWIP
jgi:hypothetical protein